MLAGALILAELERIERLRLAARYYRVDVQDPACAFHRADVWVTLRLDDLAAYLHQAPTAELAGEHYADGSLGIPLNQYGQTLEDFYLSFAECGDVVLTQGPVNLSALVRERYRRWGVWPEAQAGTEVR